jgi:hypothetical protein
MCTYHGKEGEDQEECKKCAPRNLSMSNVVTSDENVNALIH